MKCEEKFGYLVDFTLFQNPLDVFRSFEYKNVQT